MEAKFLGFSWGIWGGLCLGIALIYSFIWPKNRISGQKVTAFRYFILRWFHALMWVLLGISCFTRLFHFPEQVSNLIAICGFGVYVIFLVTLTHYPKS